MGKLAMYLVHVEIDPAHERAWNEFHAAEHVPLVVKQGAFLGAVRYCVAPAQEGTSRYVTAYRAPSLARVREYLEGGEVGRMRAHHEGWLERRPGGPARARISREVLEENHSVDAEGKILRYTPERSEGRAAFVVRARLDAETVPRWSTWYDGEHMPAVCRAGRFLRAGRWRVVDEAAGPMRFAMIYEAAGAAAIDEFRAGAGPRYAHEHQQRFGEAIHLEREVWRPAE